jgi:hypothetical protein
MKTSQSNKPWTESDIAQLKSMVAQGVHKQQIAVALGRTQGAVEVKFYQLKRNQAGPTKNRKAQQRRRTGASFFLS